MLEDEHERVALDVANGRLTDDGGGALALAADDREDLVPDTAHGDRIERARWVGSRRLGLGGRHRDVGRWFWLGCSILSRTGPVV
jgi:hypothetical protein